MNLIKFLKYSILIGLYTNSLPVYAGMTCSEALKSAYKIPDVREALTSLIKDAVPEMTKTMENYKAEQIALWSEEDSGVDVNAEILKFFPGPDIFSSRLSKLATSHILMILKDSVFGLEGWSEYMPAIPQEEYLEEAEIIDQAPVTESIGYEGSDFVMEVRDITPEVTAKLQHLPIYKYMDGEEEHSIIYNPELGILINATYRQFLIGKVSNEDFAKLPLFFIGSLSEFRALVEPLLSKEAVDIMLRSSANYFLGMSSFNGEGPTLLQFESGEKSVADADHTQVYNDLSDLEEIIDADYDGEIPMIWPLEEDSDLN